jgi:hypothetical protein
MPPTRSACGTDCCRACGRDGLLLVVFPVGPPRRDIDLRLAHDPDRHVIAPGHAEPAFVDAGLFDVSEQLLEPRAAIADHDGHGRCPRRRSPRAAWATAATGPIERVVESFNRADGRRLWEHRLPAEGPFPDLHEKHNLATPTPAVRAGSVRHSARSATCGSFACARTSCWSRPQTPTDGSRAKLGHQST